MKDSNGKLWVGKDVKRARFRRHSHKRGDGVEGEQV